MHGAPGTPPDPISTCCTAMTMLFPPAPTWAYHTFKGWSTDPTAFTGVPAGSPLGMVTAPVVYYAVWMRDTCMVNFDASGGSPTPFSQIVECGSPLTLPAGPLLSGQVFNGWSTTKGATSGAAPGLAVLIATSPVVYYAAWATPTSGPTPGCSALGSTIAFSPCSATVVAGHTTALSVTGVPSVVLGSWTWTSSNMGVATVVASVVTGWSLGTATITAQAPLSYPIAATITVLVT